MAYAQCSFNLDWSRLTFWWWREESLKCVTDQMPSGTTKSKNAL